MNKLYIKKVIIIFLVFLFILTSFGFIQGVQTQENSIDLIDQWNGAGCLGCNGGGSMLLRDGFYIAQSFTPSHNVLSKILLILKRSGSPPAGMKLTLFIRAALDGDDLVSMEKEIDSNAMIFDIQDIDVISGNLYYIIITTDDVCSENNGYGWYHSDYNFYSRGSCWTKSYASTWSENEAYDMVFFTYWKDYSPSLPNIEGLYNGTAPKRYEYTFSTTDPEGDDVEYYIKWGDGREFKWSGPYDSGEQVTKSHSWTYAGNYTIQVKARDIFGAESDWNTIEITMQKNKAIINPFLQFIEKHPYLQRLLQYIIVLN